MNPPEKCIHLSVSTVLKIHEESIRQFGGSAGLRSYALLESAVAAPQAAFAGESVFHDLVELAAAYLFYLCSNHPFVDGNKRTALAACIVFLKLNQVPLLPDSRDWEILTLDVASGKLDRETTTARLSALLPAS